MIYNQLDQPIRTIAPAPYSFYSDTIYDANNNVVETRIQNLVPILSGGHAQLDANDNVIYEIGSPAQFVNTYTYDILNNLVSEDIDATGATPSRLVTTYGYDPSENRVRVTYPEGNIVQSVYDERDLVFTMTQGFGTPLAATTTTHYDKNGNVIEVIDAEDTDGVGGAEFSRMVYDGYDRAKKVTDAAGNVVESIYDPAGNVIEAKTYGPIGGPTPTDTLGAANTLLGHVTSRFDERNRAYQSDAWLAVSAGVTTVRTPVLVDGVLTPGDGFVTSRTEYDAASRVTFTVEDDGDTTSSTVYDGVSRPVTTTDAVGNTVTSYYDANSNVVQTRATDTHQTVGRADEVVDSFVFYDVLNRATRSVDNIGNVNRVVYDSRGNTINTTDALQNTTTMSYDGASRMYRTDRLMRINGDGTKGKDITPWSASLRLREVAATGSSPHASAAPRRAWHSRAMPQEHLP